MSKPSFGARWESESIPEQAVAAAPPVAADVPEAPPAIGWPGGPPWTAEEAKRRNSEALELHRAGDYERALAGFEAALALAPEYNWARYNSACALARLGRTEEAVSLVRELWFEDLPEFLLLALADADLEALWTSAPGKALQAELVQIEAAYDHALQHGVPAFTYNLRDGERGNGKYQVPYTNLRIGVYVLDTRRFVPLVPKVDRAYSGLLDRAGKRALIASGTLEMKDMWEVQPHRASLTLFSLEDHGRKLWGPRVITQNTQVLHGFEVRFGAGSELLFTLIGVGYAPLREYFAIDARQQRELGWVHEDDEDQTPPIAQDVPYLSVVELARAVYHVGAPVTVRGRKIKHQDAPGELRLGPGHHDRRHILASPDPWVLVVASMPERFSDDGADSPDDIPPWARHTHVVDLVDFHEQTVTRLSEDRGIVHLAWADDGTLLMETSTRTVRYEPGGTTPIADIPPGVSLGMPAFPEQGGV